MSQKLNIFMFLIILNILTIFNIKKFIINCNKLEENAKVVLKYPLYTDLTSEEYNIDAKKTLGEYITIGETRLKEYFGGHINKVRIKVNEVELEESEFNHLITEFLVSENEDIVIEYVFNEKLEGNLDNEDDQKNGLNENKGILIFRFTSFIEGEIIKPSRLPASVTTEVIFPLTNRNLMNLIKEYVKPEEFSIEFISTPKNKSVNLLDKINEKTLDKDSGIVNGELMLIKVKDLKQEQEFDLKEKEEKNQEIQETRGGDRYLPVSIIFSNRKELSNRRVNLDENSKISDLLEIINNAISETGKRLISTKNEFSIQNEEGREIDQNEEIDLKQFIPEEIEVSDEKPFLLYVTIFGDSNKNDDMNNYNTELSNIFDSKDYEETSNFMKDNIENKDIKELDLQEKNLESEVGFPPIHFVYKEANFEIKLRNDPTFTTLASLYSQAQLIWSSMKEVEKNCLLIYDTQNMKEYEILNPNEHETLITSRHYNQGLKLIMRNPQKKEVNIEMYIKKDLKKTKLGSMNIIKKLNLKIPEIISVTDFLKELNKKYYFELSKYLIIGIQKETDDNKLVEYLSNPRTPSSITYITFVSDLKSSKLLLEVDFAKNIDILLMIPSAIIKEASGSELSGENKDELLVEYRISILSNMTVKELIETLIKKKILNVLSSKVVYLKDYLTKSYLNNNYVLGYHNLDLDKLNENEDKNKMIFEIEILNEIDVNISFYYPQGDDYTTEILNVSFQRNVTVKKLKEIIISQVSNKKIFLENYFSVASGFDLGDEFKKVVYSVLREKDKIEENGINPSDDLRVYILKDIENNKLNSFLLEGFDKKKQSAKPSEKKIFNIENINGPKIEVPLVLENCPLNTLLEKRWFIVPITLDVLIEDLKILIDSIAMLGGLDFDLSAETEKGKIQLNENKKSCSSLGLKEIGLFTVTCRKDGKSDLINQDFLNKSLAQAIIEDTCSLGNLESCRNQKDESLNQSKIIEKKTIENSKNILFEEPKNEETKFKEDKESMVLLKKIEERIKNLEQKEFKSKKNKKVMDQIIKYEEKLYEKNELSERELKKLLKEFLISYFNKGAKGLNRFCKNQGSEKIEQLILYLSTLEGKRMARKTAEKFADMIRKNKKKEIMDEDKAIIEMEYIAIPKLGQYFSKESFEDNSEEVYKIKKPKQKRNSKNKIKSKKKLNKDLQPVTDIQNKKKKSRISKIFNRIPIISPTISYLYSRLTTKGRKKRRAIKYIKEIRDLELQFRKKSYGNFEQNFNLYNNQKQKLVYQEHHEY